MIKLRTAILSFCIMQSVISHAATNIRENIKDMTYNGHNPVRVYKLARRFIFQRLHLRKDDQGYFVKDVYCEKKFRTKVGPDNMPKHTIINVEHTWPKKRFNKTPGKMISYNIQVSDLHNLYPTDSRANSIRGSHFFADLENGGKVIDDNCKISHIGKIPFLAKTGFEPPANHRGNIARSLFYFAFRYDRRIPYHEEEVLREWHREDPVDADEIERNTAIEEIQGNRNPFIDNPELINQIQDI